MTTTDPAIDQSDNMVDFGFPNHSFTVAFRELELVGPMVPDVDIDGKMIEKSLAIDPSEAWGVDLSRSDHEQRLRVALATILADQMHETLEWLTHNGERVFVLHDHNEFENWETVFGAAWQAAGQLCEEITRRPEMPDE